MRTSLIKEAQAAREAAKMLRKEASTAREVAKETRRQARRIAEEMKNLLDASRHARVPR